MKIHYLQHVPFEDLAVLEELFLSRGHTVSCTRFFEDDPLPAVSDFDWLVIMGGPMGIFDERLYPWLAKEKHFIKQAIDAEKTVLGICLGAQFLAHVLGARVFKNEHREIGWFELTPSKEMAQTPLKDVFSTPLTVFHWHGDTFDIPEDAVPIGSTEACANQGFIYGDNIVALQFHIESTPDSIESLLSYCQNELDGSQFVQSASLIRVESEQYNSIHPVAEKLIIALGA